MKFLSTKWNIARVLNITGYLVVLAAFIVLAFVFIFAQQYSIPYLLFLTHINMPWSAPLVAMTFLLGMMCEHWYFVASIRKMMHVLVVPSIVMLGTLPLVETTKEFVELPLIFFPLYCIILMVFYKEQIIRKITDGYVFVQTLALFVSVAGYLVGSLELFIPIVALLIFPLIKTTFYAFSGKQPKKKEKFWLSLWGNAIMSYFSIIQIIYLVRIFSSSADILAEPLGPLSFLLIVFFSGVSAMYLAANTMNLISGFGFMPTRHNISYYRTHTKDLIKEYIAQFSGKQIRIHHAKTFAVTFVLLFALNSFTGFLPTTTFVWMTFFAYKIIENTDENIRRSGKKNKRPRDKTPLVVHV